MLFNSSFIYEQKKDGFSQISEFCSLIGPVITLSKTGTPAEKSQKLPRMT